VAHSDPVRSVLRGLDIIDLVARSEQGMTLRDICDVLGLKQATAYNLLRTLVSRNYVDRTGDPVRYRLGRTVVRLADERARHELVRRAESVLLRLYDDLVAVLPRKPEAADDVAVSFAQSIGGEIRLMLRVRSDRPGMITRPMSVMGPYRSTSSLLYQAYWTREERAAYRREHPFTVHGEPWWKTEAKLNTYLIHIRQEGFASPPIYHADEFRMSAPVFGAGHVLMGTVGVGVWMRVSKLVRFRLQRLTLDAAKALSSPPTAPVTTLTPTRAVLRR
jgi:DNA-binding IclR family transcriptional regulator